MFWHKYVEQLQTLPKTQSEIDISPFLKTQKPSIIYSIARRKTTSQGWTIMMFTLRAGINCFIILKLYFFFLASLLFRLINANIYVNEQPEWSRVCVFLEMGLYRSRIEFLVMFEVVQHCLYENVPHKWWIKKSMITTCNERRINR
jgi:hypothetical protein